MREQTTMMDGIASINGVALHAPGEQLPADELRQRACTELLRQAARCVGLLAIEDAASADGVISEAATQAIEALLEQEIRLPEPSEEALRRHFDAHRPHFAMGEKVRLRQILFAVTPGMDVTALREHAEQVLLDVRCHGSKEDGGFALRAREYSNCPSGARGGDLGVLTETDCAPEFAREIFGRPEVGVLPRLVHSRFGLHVVEVSERIPGAEPHFEAVHPAVAHSMQRTAYVTALRQYLRWLAGQACVIGVDLEAAETPLVQ